MNQINAIDGQYKAYSQKAQKASEKLQKMQSYVQELRSERQQPEDSEDRQLQEVEEEAQYGVCFENDDLYLLSKRQESDIQEESTRQLIDYILKSNQDLSKNILHSEQNQLFSQQSMIPREEQNFIELDRGSSSSEKDHLHELQSLRDELNFY